MNPVLSSPVYDCKAFTDVPYLDSTGVYNEESDELTIFAVNRHLSEGLELEVDVRSFEGYRLVEHIVLEHNDLKAVNKAGEENVAPHNGGNAAVNGGILSAKLSRTSWNVIRLAKV